MYQVAVPVWNQIGETVPLKTDWAKQMFPLPEDQMEKALALEEKRLMRTEEGVVAAAYLKMMPLLWEREAIAQYKAEHPEWEAALPEVNDVEEAVMLASEDLPLTRAQQGRLRKLLSTLPL